MTNQPTQSSEFVLRRLEDGFRFAGREYSGAAWGFIVGLVLLSGLAFALWFYLRERRTLGLPRVLGLFSLRALTYLILAAVFMLPAMQTWEERTLKSHVLVAFDVSSSMTTTIDALPDGKTPLDQLPRRQDRVLAMLGSGEWIAQLSRENPLELHRFARGLMGPGLRIIDGKVATAEEWKRLENPGEGENPTPIPLADVSDRIWPTWLKPGRSPVPSGEDAASKWLARLNESGVKAFKGAEDRGTSLAGSLIGIGSAAAGAMARGIVVFSDGRSTEESTAALAQLREQARVANLPLIVVGIGEDRPVVKTEIADLRAPGLVQPDDPFRLVMDVTGEGLSGLGLPDPTLEIRNVRKLPGDRVEEREVELVQANDPNARLTLGKVVRIKPPPATFDASTPPRASLEVILDPAALAKAAGKELPQVAGGWVFGETGDGALRVTGVVGRDKRELSPTAVASRGPVDIRIEKKPLRVLLMAGAASREYQFVRNLFVRELEKKRAEVSIYLQLPGGALSKRGTLVQDVPPERMLDTFPDRFDTDSPDPAQRMLDLASYDCILAFDPDWSQLSDIQRNVLNNWVDRGGGLVIVSGPVNTLQLAKPGADRTSLKAILDLYPVLLRDLRLDGADRALETPFPLKFEATTPDMEFLRLDEDQENKPFLSDWADFFNSAGRPDEVSRGFFTAYPVEDVRKGALVAARLGDERTKLKDGKLSPWLVLSDPASGKRIVWIGSDETWRLRAYRETWHERFWTKLARFAAANSRGKDVRRIRLFVGGPYQAGRPISFEATIDDRGGKPLGPQNDPPRLKLEAPSGVNEGDYPTLVKLEPRPGAPGVWRARFQVRAAGRYQMTVEVPSTKDKLAGTSLVIEAADPESENTRPDWNSLHEIASPFSMIESRLGEEQARKIKEMLRRPARGSNPGAPAKEASNSTSARGAETSDEAKLLFDLSAASVIPQLLPGQTSTLKNRGPVDDLWDEGPSLGQPTGDNPVARVIPWAMLAVTLLLTVEWTLRKLWKVA